jgi:hypothetical protein
MSLFSYVRSIYALDSLDTRFTISSTTPYKSVVDSRASHTKSKLSQADAPLEVPIQRDSDGHPLTQPSKWKTPEFYFYYFVFLTVIPYMFWVVYDVSRRQLNEYLSYGVLRHSDQLFQRLILTITNMRISYHQAGYQAVKSYALRFSSIGRIFT